MLHAVRYNHRVSRTLREKANVVGSVSVLCSADLLLAWQHYQIFCLNIPKLEQFKGLRSHRMRELVTQFIHSFLHYFSKFLWPRWEVSLSTGDFSVLHNEPAAHQDPLSSALN